MIDLPNVSKLCSDHLRVTHNTQSTKLKASHARELVAAYFGFKSHAALLACRFIELQARKVIPDPPLMQSRRERLTGLPDDLASTADLVSQIETFLQEHNL